MENNKVVETLTAVEFTAQELLQLDLSIAIRLAEISKAWCIEVDGNRQTALMNESIFLQNLSTKIKSHFPKVEDKKEEEVKA